MINQIMELQMEKIESLQNSRVKEWTKLKTKKGRKKQNSYLLEGWHLVKEALLAQADLAVILMTVDFKKEASLAELLKKSNCSAETIQISTAVEKKISDTNSPQGIFAVAAITPNFLQVPKNLAGKWLLLDNIQDPGNLGTMVRTADAAGFTGVILGKKTVDLFQPKVTRSMQGSQFHLRLIQGDLNDWIKDFKKQAIPVYGTKVDALAVDYRKVKKTSQFALVMGNEGNGVAPEILQQTTQNLYIPLDGQAESLNVAVAAGILMFALVNK